MLRFAGALAGGAIGLAAQVFVLPGLESISGFLALFVAVSLASAWVATSGPRLSYLGVQIAVAFFLMNLQEYRFQMSLEVAWDRVAGVLFGLVVMWVVFDQLGGAPAAEEMKRTFLGALRLMAHFEREPAGRDVRAVIERSYVLRRRINGNFERARQHGEGVMLEFGALRARMLEWQLQLRLILIAGVALFKYRLRLPGFELPAPVLAAQKAFDERHAATLEAMADRFEGKPAAGAAVTREGG